jgi:hypothetical protein
MAAGPRELPPDLRRNETDRGTFWGEKGENAPPRHPLRRAPVQPLAPPAAEWTADDPDLGQTAKVTLPLPRHQETAPGGSGLPALPAAEPCRAVERPRITGLKCGGGGGWYIGSKPRRRMEIPVYIVY